jgi:hypothetical protein
MEKIFVVEYNDYDEVCNMDCNAAGSAEENLKRQINFTKNLKSNGYTHVQDYSQKMYTGEELCTIDDYLTDLYSYL